jgi:hypothetical protein
MTVASHAHHMGSLYKGMNFMGRCLFETMMILRLEYQDMM